MWLSMRGSAGLQLSCDSSGMRFGALVTALLSLRNLRNYFKSR